jgi:hypothetical protein
MTFFKKIISKEQSLKEIKLCAIQFSIQIIIFLIVYYATGLNKKDPGIMGIVDIDMILMVMMLVLFYFLKSRIGAIFLALITIYFLLAGSIQFDSSEWQSYFLIILYLAMNWTSARAVYSTTLLDEKFKD